MIRRFSLSREKSLSYFTTSHDSFMAVKECNFKSSNSSKAAIRYKKIRRNF